MRVSRDELVLLGLDLILEEKELGGRYTKDDLSLALDIKLKSLNDYVTRLKKAGLINTVQKKFVKDIATLITFSEKGKDRVGILWESVDRFVLTPEHHNIPSIIKVRTILDRLRDPLEKLFFLSVYSANTKFDLMTFLDVLKISISDSNIVNIFSEMDIEKEKPSHVPFIISFSKTSFHGGFNQKLLHKDAWSEKDPNIILVIAEAERRQGKLKDAKAYYEFLLSPNIKLTQNQWFLTRMGMVQTLSKMGETQKSLKLLDDTMAATNNKTFLAYCKQMKAIVFSILGKFDDSLKLYMSAIRSFHSYGLPLMLAIAYNNRGTLYYRMGDYENAEEDWKKARRFAKEARSEYCEAMIIMNLADISGLKGQFDLAFNYLNKSMKILEKFRDLGGVAMTYYNISLVFLIMKDLDKALENYRISMTIAEPLPSLLTKNEMRLNFIKYGSDNEFKNIETII